MKVKLETRYMSFAAMAATLALALSACQPAGDTGPNDTVADADPTADVETRGRPEPENWPGEWEGDEYVIGLVASQNGPLRPWGADCVAGAQLAVDEINAAGGIDGKMVQLVVEDSASTPEGGKSATEKLVSDGVIGILGEVASGITQPMTQVTYENGIPHVIVGGTKTTLTDYGSNIFRVCYTDDFQGPVVAAFAYEDLGLREMAIMTDEKQPYSQYLSQKFREYFEGLGGEIVAEESYESGQTTFNSQISNLKSKNPEGVFLSGYFTEVGAIARQMGQLGMDNVALLGGDGWDSSELLESGGEAIIGGFFCNHYSDFEDRPEVKAFLQAWDAEYGGQPGTTMGALGYDAAMLMMDAIDRAEVKDSRSIIEALDNTVDYPAVSGSITLKGMEGDPAKPALILEVTPEGFRPRTSYTYEEIFGTP